MIRTQIYLTEEERAGLNDVSRATGRKQSELIREAVDLFLDLADGNLRDIVLKEAAGLWRESTGLPDFTGVRRSWNREQDK